MSPVRLRKRPSSSQPVFVTIKEPKLAKVSDNVQCHVFSYNLLPTSNDRTDSELVQFLLSDFVYHSVPDLDLNFVHDKVGELQANAPEARVNVFLVDFIQYQRFSKFGS